MIYYLYKLDVIEHVHVGKNCSTDESEAYKALFKEFRDIFAWSYEEMPRIDPSIVVHKIKTYPMAKPVRKKLRQVHPSKAAAIKAEIEKLLKVGFYLSYTPDEMGIERCPCQ